MSLLNYTHLPYYILYSNPQKFMGCESSQLTRTGPQVKISIVDSSFMKLENEHIRKEMQDQNIIFQYFISLECFFDEFKKRYYNKVVTTIQNYPEMKSRLHKLGLTPNIYVILDGKQLDQTPSVNVTTIPNYQELIKYIRQHATPSIIVPYEKNISQTFKKRVCTKILCKPSPKTSEQTIFQTALKKANISYEFYNSFQLLQQSLNQTQCTFIVTDYIFHREVIELFNGSKTRVICYCQFQKNQTYAPQIYSLSNNYLDITADIKNEIKSDIKHTVKCTKVYLYSKGLADEEEIADILAQFEIQVRIITNLQKIIKQTSHFFCVTVITADTESKNVAKYLERNDYLERVKILSISTGTEASVKGLYKLIRNIKKGYKVARAITNSIDIIDKHYNSTKFQEIKKQLQSNDIKCFGFSSINEYIKNKKFVSPFIICNYEEKALLLKYMKQLQCMSKVIVFCNKNKITLQLKQNKNYAFVSSHFGKIIKFIKKTYVYMPSVDKQDQLLFKQKIEKLKTKNKRISALKWSHINDENAESQKNFQFLNIAKETNNGSIREIQKVISTIWKADGSVAQLQKFKVNFINSLNQLRRANKINFQQTHFTALIEKIKLATISELLEKVKTFFDADNELGLQINKTLMKTESLDKNEICNMKQFLVFVFLNYWSGYQIPRIGTKKLSRWISSSLIEKCSTGSYLFCKQFTIFYDDAAAKISQIGKYKLQLQLQFNTLTEQDLLLNSYISYKDKFIFSPFTQFQVQNIFDNGQYKTIVIKFCKNVDFLKYIFADNIIPTNSNLKDFSNELITNESKLVDEVVKQKFTSNILRIKSIQFYHKQELEESIKIHKKLIQQNEEKQNLDSALINELNFELASIYFKANKNREAGEVIKQLLQSDPGEFIKKQCQSMVKSVVQEKQSNDGSPKKRRISEQAMKTFIWLKNKQQQGHSQRSDDEGSQNDEEEPQIFQNQFKCIDVEDIGQNQ